MSAGSNAILRFRSPRPMLMKASAPSFTKPRNVSIDTCSSCAACFGVSRLAKPTTGADCRRIGTARVCWLGRIIVAFQKELMAVIATARRPGQGHE